MPKPAHGLVPQTVGHEVEHEEERVRTFEANKVAPGPVPVDMGGRRVAGSGATRNSGARKIVDEDAVPCVPRVGTNAPGLPHGGRHLDGSPQRKWEGQRTREGRRHRR